MSPVRLILRSLLYGLPVKLSHIPAYIPGDHHGRAIA
jgi:hypothetical protein